MNNIHKKLTAFLVGTLSAISGMAQVSATGYFMENYNMRWQMNPAMDCRHNYVGFPALGNVNADLNGNLDPTDIVYNRNGKTVLFTNPEVSASEVLNNLNDNNRISQNVNLAILQGGFKAFGGYNNIAVNVKGNMSLAVPKSLFSLLKEGVANKTYNIKDFHMKSNAYAEIALNHSREIKEVNGLRAGVSVKILLPVLYAETELNDLALELGEDNWHARSDAEMKVAMKGFRYKTKLNERTHNYYVSGGNTDDLKFGFNGIGFGVDLGATYQWSDFCFSLALTDLGMLKYNSVQLASTGGPKIFNTENHVIGIGDDGDSWDKLVDDLAPLYELEDMGDMGSTNVGLNGKIRIGVDYQFPLYQKLHFGLMNTTNLSSIFPMTEFRLSANVEPVKGIAVSASAAAGTYGANYGFLLSLGNKGFNFILGMDYAALKMDKNHIPLTSNCDFHMGINFPF